MRIQCPNCMTIHDVMDISRGNDNGIMACTACLSIVEFDADMKASTVSPEKLNTLPAYIVNILNEHIANEKARRAGIDRSVKAICPSCKTSHEVEKPLPGGLSLYFCNACTAPFAMSPDASVTTVTPEIWDAMLPEEQKRIVEWKIQMVLATGNPECIAEALTTGAQALSILENRRLERIADNG